MALTVPIFEIFETIENRLLAKDEPWERILLGDIANKGVLTLSFARRVYCWVY